MTRTFFTLSTFCGFLLLAGSSRAADEKQIQRAIDNGVLALKGLQSREGTWRHTHIGATALAGLTLLECGESPKSDCIKKAAQSVRGSSVGLTHTYSISLAIMFLDKLGDPADIPLIESLTVRLLAGQNARGGWTYYCPAIGADEVRRLTRLLKQRNELKAGVGDLGKRKPGRRTVKDLSPEIKQQLRLINRLAPARGGRGGMIRDDNSNTQFATLGLWVGRRHGLPVNQALARVDARFRQSQKPSGGWGYVLWEQKMRGGPLVTVPDGQPNDGVASTAAMTCAGLLGLAINHGAVNEVGGKKRNLKKDRSLNAGLLALSTAIGLPKDPRRFMQLVPKIQRSNGTAYYFLWSVERVGVALGLKTIGKKDWYEWGSQILLANQDRDGAWRANYAQCGADTCFALLFLKRSNLAEDLTSQLRGRVSDPSEVTLKGGGVGGVGLRPPTKKIKSALDPDAKIENGLKEKPKPKTGLPSVPDKVEDKVTQLSDALVEASDRNRGRILKSLKENKGGQYTAALAMSIPLLEGSAKKDARHALAERLTRMTEGTLKKYLSNTDSEIRRAASLAIAMRDIDKMVPDLIEMLADPEASVVRAVHAGLKAMTKKDFGPSRDATPAQIERAMKAWKAWWASK